MDEGVHGHLSNRKFGGVDLDSGLYKDWVCVEVVEMLSPRSAPLVGALLVRAGERCLSERFGKEVELLLSDCLLWK